MTKLLKNTIALLGTSLLSAHAGDLRMSFGFPFQEFTPGIFHGSATPPPGYIRGAIALDPSKAWFNTTGHTIYIKKTSMWFRPAAGDTLVVGWAQRRSDIAMLAYVPISDQYYDIENFDTNYFALAPGDAIDFFYYSSQPSAMSCIIWYTVGSP